MDTGALVLLVALAARPGGRFGAPSSSRSGGRREQPATDRDGGDDVGDYVVSGAKYGATGATIGTAILPGVGTAIGGGLGILTGVVVEYFDEDA